VDFRADLRSNDCEVTRPDEFSLRTANNDDLLIPCGAGRRTLTRICGPSTKQASHENPRRHGSDHSRNSADADGSKLSAVVERGSGTSQE